MDLLPLPLLLLQGCKDFSVNQDTPPPYQPVDDNHSSEDTSGTDTDNECIPETCDDGVLEESRTTNTQATCLSFSDKSTRVGLNSSANHAGLSITDYDNDGQQDIFVLNYASPNQMLRNLGGNFQDVSATVGLDFGGDSRQAVWNDYDSDGDTDLFLVGSSGSSLYKNSANHFAQVNQLNSEAGKTAAWLGSNLILGTENGLRYYKYQGGDSYTDITNSSLMVDVNEAAKIAVADYDGDGLDDVYVANVTGQNRLFHNLGNDTFESVEDSANAAEYSNEASTDADWVSIQGEALPSLYVSDYNGGNALYTNQQDGTFVDDSAPLGLHDGGQTTSAAFADILNEARPSLFLGRWEQQNLLYIPILNNDGSVDHFEDYAQRLDMDASMQTMDAEWLDYDNDGDEDLTVADYSGQIQLFDNNTRTITLCP